MLEERRVQTSVLYPAIQEFSAYRGAGRGLERSERAAATQLTLPLYPHLTETDQDRVVAALADGLAELSAPSSPAGSARRS
jgi:dTDP-4-amino-4,6-dideoxygalactose transaminase